MIEAQCRYLGVLVEKVIDAKRAGGSLMLQPTSQAVERYNRSIQTELEQSSFADVNCSSWYKSATGKVTNNWSGTAIAYQEQLSRVCWDDYIVRGKEKERVPTSGVMHIGRVREEYGGLASAWVVSGLVAAVSGILLVRANAWHSLSMLLGSER